MALVAAKEKLDFSEEKTAIRKLAKARRDQFFDHPDRPRAQALILSHLKSYIKENQFEKVAIYRASGSEVDISGLMEDRCPLAFPKVYGKDIHFFFVNSLESFSSGPFGILEPDSDEKVDCNDLDLIVVPGLAFDKKAYRIGYGGGFYDRCLEAYKGTKLAVAFDVQLFNKDLPIEDHDIPMDDMITESGRVHS